jgi:hypothetical protein
MGEKEFLNEGEEPNVPDTWQAGPLTEKSQNAILINIWMFSSNLDSL